MQRDQPSGPVGLPYQGRTTREGHPWEQPEQPNRSERDQANSEQGQENPEQEGSEQEQPEQQQRAEPRHPWEQAHPWEQGAAWRGQGHPWEQPSTAFVPGDITAAGGVATIADTPESPETALETTAELEPVAAAGPTTVPGTSEPVLVYGAPDPPASSRPEGDGLLAGTQQPAGQPSPGQQSAPQQPASQQPAAEPGAAWQQRAEQPASFGRLIATQWRTLFASTTRRVLLGLAAVVALLVTWLTATQVNQGGPDLPTYRIFGLVLACQIAPVPLYAIVLRAISAEWHSRSVELTYLYVPRRARIAVAHLAVLVPLWAGITLVQFAMYVLLKPGLSALWVLGVAALGGLLSLLFVLAIGLLVAHPVLAVVVYLVLSVAYLVRVVNPLVLRWVDPWQPASRLAGSVPELPPSVTSGVLLIGAVLLGFVLASRR